MGRVLISAISLLAILTIVRDVVDSAPSQKPTSVAPEEDVVTTPVQVDSVKTILLPTYPGRVQIVVHGQRVPEAAVDVKQERKGSEVTIKMTQTLPRQIQPEVESFQQRVHLEGGFEPGIYSLTLNAYSTTFEIK